MTSAANAKLAWQEDQSGGRFSTVFSICTFEIMLGECNSLKFFPLWITSCDLWGLKKTNTLGSMNFTMASSRSRHLYLLSIAWVLFRSWVATVSNSLSTLKKERERENGKRVQSLTRSFLSQDWNALLFHYSNMSCLWQSSILRLAFLD